MNYPVAAERAVMPYTGTAVMYAHSDPIARFTVVIFQPAACVSASISRYVRSLASNKPSIYDAIFDQFRNDSYKQTETHGSVKKVSVRARLSEIGQERRSFGDKRAYRACGRAIDVRLVVNARVRQEIVDEE